MNPLSSDEQLGSLLKPVRVTECNLGKGSTSARIMNDVLLEQTPALGQLTAFATGSAETKALQKLKMIAIKVILMRRPLSQRSLDFSWGE